MEIVIELTEEELKKVAGGVGASTFSLTQSASGTIAAVVTGTLAQATTPTSATQSGTFSSVSV